MRVRKKKHCAERLQACSSLFLRKEDTEGRDFCCLEIGCGKGAFIEGTARKYPERFFIGVEKVPDVLVTAMEKINGSEINNIRFLCEDAGALADILGEGSVKIIYLNFSDPWPKKKQAKRRLTSPGFLEVYKKILSEDGEIRFKTDNAPLFEYSVEEISNNGFEIKEITRDLPPEGLDGENVMTEYEKNFRSQSVKINYLRAIKK